MMAHPTIEARHERHLMMRRFISRIDRGLYAHYSDNWDNALFRELLLSALGPQSDVLDLGAGSGYVRQMNLREGGGLRPWHRSGPAGA